MAQSPRRNSRGQLPPPIKPRPTPLVRKTFRSLLVSVADSISSSELETLIFLSSDIIASQREKDKIKTPLQLFDVLIKRDAINENKIDVLIKLLSKIKHFELREKVKKRWACLMNENDCEEDNPGTEIKDLPQAGAGRDIFEQADGSSIAEEFRKEDIDLVSGRKSSSRRDGIVLPSSSKSSPVSSMLAIIAEDPENSSDSLQEKWNSDKQDTKYTNSMSPQKDQDSPDSPLSQQRDEGMVCCQDNTASEQNFKNSGATASSEVNVPSQVLEAQTTPMHPRCFAFSSSMRVQQTRSMYSLKIAKLSAKFASENDNQDLKV